MSKYNHQKIEEKWQKKWVSDKTFTPDLLKAKNPYYALFMFPYPSAEGLHIGNFYAFVCTDVMAKYKKLQGFDVFEPFGFDAFGMHLENYALKIGERPQVVEKRTTAYFRKQVQVAGLSCDYTREVDTTKPEYYKWTQWIFTKLFEKDMAYQKEALLNWCPSCQTVLADEQIEGGVCERCKTTPKKKTMKQWFFRITAYAQRLLDGLDDMNWSEITKSAQKNWIGRSEGARVKFQIPLSVSLGFQTQAEDKKTGEGHKPQLGLKTQPNDKNRKIWFLSFSTKRRKDYFNSKEKCLNILSYFTESCLRHDFKPHEIVVMHNHVHLLIDTDREIDVAKIYKYLKGYSAKQFIEKYDDFDENAKGRHLWTPKGDYKIIENKQQYNKAISYIRNNPEKEGLIKADRLLFENINNLYNEIEVFTTRPDTLFGATYFVLSPEHSLVAKITEDKYKKDVEEYIKTAGAKSEMERTENKEKTGAFTGAYAVNPVNNEKIPVWIADYVMMGYGTGAIMAVPAHDERDHEFAKKYNLPINEVVQFCHFEQSEESLGETDEVFTGDGVAVNSDFLDGLKTEEAKKKIIKWLEKKGLGKSEVNYRLRDWCISRQRYWGPPVPIIYCEKCGVQAVPISDLPVLLPELDKGWEPAGDGRGPLAKVDEFMNVECPKCSGLATREADVMDNFLDSAWYFFRYITPQNEKEIFDKKLGKKWLPIDLYIGGNEHAVLHLMYTRFITMFFNDLGLINFDDPFKKFRANGMILKDGKKMSKSKGNVINPEEYGKKVGYDALRTYLLFLGPLSEDRSFTDPGVQGTKRWVEKIARLESKISSANKDDEKVIRKLHQTIKKVTDDFEEQKYNTAVAALMELTNLLTGAKQISKDTWQKLLIIIAPFAPALAEEMWARAGFEKSIFENKNWPKHDPKLAKDETIQLVIQINGKLRDTLEADVDISEAKAKKIAQESKKIKKWTESKEIVKIIFVKGKLVNIVVK